MAYGSINADVIGTSVQGYSLGAGNSSLLKNKIINGAMVVAQRGTSAFTQDTSNTYTLDRFYITGGVTSKFTAQQSSTAPAGFVNSLKLTSSAATSVGSTDYYFMAQSIEGYNVADLNWGTANAKTITLSFQVNSSVTGTYGGALRNASNNRCYPFTYTISSANTWTPISITIAGDTTGTWATDNSVGINVVWGLGVGSTYSATAGTWTASTIASATGATNWISTNGATFYITGVQLEVGSSATGFEYRQYTTELQLCQRYCFLLTSVGGSGSYIRWATGENSGTTGNNTPIMFPTTMRTNASLTTTGTASNYMLSSNGSGIAVTAISTQSNACTNQTHAISVSVASGLVSGGCTTLASNNNNTAYLLFTAEL